MGLPEIISLNCPKCGATLSVPKGLNYFSCNYCNSKLALFQNDSVIGLKIFSENIMDVKNDMDAIASEMALKRHQEELSRLLDLQNALSSMIAYVQVSASSHHKDDHYLDCFISTRFKLLAKYSILNILDKKPGSPKRGLFSGEPDSIKIKSQLMTLFSIEDFKILLSEVKTGAINFTKEKEKLAIEKYIDRIEELIIVITEIEEKRKQISTIKDRLF